METYGDIRRHGDTATYGDILYIYLQGVYLKFAT